MSRKRVLIVGNEPSAVESIESCLSRNGYAVTSPAIPVHEALHAVERDETHLILMDVTPEYEADAIRTAVSIRDEYGLPVVYMTGKETCGTIRATEPIGYVMKPVDEEQLIMILETAFYKHEMERKLREYECRLDSIMNIFTDLVYRLDADGSITFINDAVRKYGYTPEELKATDIFRIIHPDDRDKALYRINERRTGKRRTKAFEFRLLPKWVTGAPHVEKMDETRKKPPVMLLHSEGLYSTERPEASGFVGTQGIAIDITERKEIEEALRRSEYRYRGLFENMGAGATVYEAVDDGRDFVLRDINGAGERMEDVKREEVLGKRLAAVFPEAVDSGLLEVLRRVWSTGKPEHHSTPFPGDVGTVGRRKSYVRRIQSGEIIVVFDDVSGGPRSDEELDYRLCIEEAIFEISVKFINCKPEEIDSRIREALRRIGECLGADRSYVFLLRDGGGNMINAYEWCSEGIGHRAEYMKEVPVEGFPWLMGRLRRLETVHIPRVAALPPEAAAERESLWSQGVRSSVLVPLIIGEIPEGFLGLDSVKSEKAWTEEDIKLLKIVGETIISALERTRIEKALEFEHAQLLSIFDSINEVVYVSDIDTYEILYVNRYLRELMGKDPTGGLCYKEIQGCDSPCDFCTNEIIKNLQGEPYRWEYHNPILNKDYMILDRLIKWPDSRNVRFEFAVDITERKKAEEEVRKQNEFLNYLLESLTHPFFVINVKDYTVVTANTAARSTMSSGAKCHEIIHGKDKPCSLEGIRCPIDVIKETKKHVVIEHTHVDKNGNERAHEIHGFPIFNENGEIEQIIEYLLDITERKQLESQFLQAQKMESIGRLAGGIAHDFNNLLTAIIGNVEMILMTISQENIIYEEVNEIKKSAERAADLTRQLLAFSRRQVIEPRVVDLNDLITGMEKMLRRLIGEDIELLTCTHEELWPVRIDPGQVEQILTNLVVNARDAMPGGGMIIIETGNVVFDEEYVKNHMGSIPGEYVMMAVSDTGMGMDERTKQHIFEPFFTTKGKWKGTGLGLSTCYGIVKQNNGFIWVYSEPGHGTTMKIYLPRVHETPGFETEKDELVEISGGMETILLVEDEPSVRKMIFRTLSEKGYRVMEASNGEEALRLIEERNTGEIHLVIADVIMPRMGGRDLIERVKRYFPGLKVLYISGYTDNSIVNHCMLPPGRNFLQKPFSTAALIHKVRQVLNE